MKYENVGDMIITIDGSAGSGKTLAAHKLADALGIRLLHTGAMYRAAAVALQLAGIDLTADPRDTEFIERIVGRFRFVMTGDDTVLNGINLTALLGSEDAGRGASRVGTFIEVRTKLKAEQRRLAAGQSTICEGRDQGTSVFPEAPLKFYFIASVEVRAARRCEQLRQRGIDCDSADISAQITARDRQDTERQIDPLRQAADAIAIDTSDLSPNEVLKQMLSAVDRCHSRA